MQIQAAVKRIAVGGLVGSRCEFAVIFIVKVQHHQLHRAAARLQDLQRIALKKTVALANGDTAV